MPSCKWVESHFNQFDPTDRYSESGQPVSVLTTSILCQSGGQGPMFGCHAIEEEDIV
jgi:hypothetical protein